MHYPLIDRHLLSQLRLVHGGFNTSVLPLFSIMRGLGRRSGVPEGAKRRFLPRDQEAPGKRPPSGFGGCHRLLYRTRPYSARHRKYSGVSVILSRKIKGQESLLRTPHAYIGIAILCLYVIEVFIRIGVLL
jgi:hypothetical protein